MLHILTISSRFHLLPQIWQSIKNHKDITWHIAKSIYRQDKIEEFGDERVKIYNSDCQDTDTGFKMNYLFNQIKDKKENYFCILDDDTLFYSNMYYTYEKYVGSKIGMIIGIQEDKQRRVRLYPSFPYECAIDSGNVLCNTEVLNNEQWSSKHWDEEFHADFDFWNRVFKFYGIKRTDVVMETISVYNSLSDVKDSLDYVRS